MWRGGVHLLGDRAERHAAVLQVGDDRQEVRQLAAEAVEFPDNQNVTVPEIGEASHQARSIILGAGRSILMKMTFVHTRGNQCIALQIDLLTFVGGGYAHVADQHVPKTPRRMFSPTEGIRQGLSPIFILEAGLHLMASGMGHGKIVNSVNRLPATQLTRCRLPRGCRKPRAPLPLPFSFQWSASAASIWDTGSRSPPSRPS